MPNRKRDDQSPTNEVIPGTARGDGIKKLIKDIEVEMADLNRKLDVLAEAREVLVNLRVHNTEVCKECKKCKDGKHCVKFQGQTVEGKILCITEGIPDPPTT